MKTILSIVGYFALHDLPQSEIENGVLEYNMEEDAFNATKTEQNCFCFNIHMHIYPSRYRLDGNIYHKDL